MFPPGKYRSVLLMVFLFLLASVAAASPLQKGISLYESKQFQEAFPLIEKEAQNGNAEAQYYLGRMYRWGEGTHQDLDKAFHWYSKGAKQGNRKAQNNLAFMYFNGLGVQKDLKKAFELYTLSAEQGTAAAQFNLGMMYRDGIGVQQDYSTAFDLFSKAAASGDKMAMHAIGQVYHFGEGVPVNLDNAIFWYKKAAAQGYAPSMANLGALYYPEDVNDTQSWEEAHKWYTLAIEHGDKTNAPFGLGLIYLFGRGNYTIDNDKAASLFTLAAENGKADAWYWLGVMEEYGFGRPQNEEKAMALYRKAADAGVQPAINRLEHGHRDWSMKLFKALRPLFGP